MTEELDGVGKGIEIISIVTTETVMIDSEDLKNKYLIDYVFSLAKYITELVQEDPTQIYPEVKQRISDTIENLQYFVKTTEEEEKREWYQVALDGYNRIQQEIESNNL